MNRRRALAIAGTVTATVAGAALAFSANVGLLGFSRADTSALGELQADQPLSLAADETPSTSLATTTTLPPEVVVQYEDVVVEDGPANAPAPSANASTDDAGDEGVGPGEGTTTTIASQPAATTSTVVDDQRVDEASDDSEVDDHASDDSVDDHVEPVEVEHPGEADDD